MNRNLIAAVVAIVVLAAGAAVFFFGRTEPPPPAAGIPETLATERAGRVSNLRYDVTLRIPSSRKEAVSGHLRATFTLSDADKPLAFDFAQPSDRLLGMHANGSVIEPVVREQHVVVPSRKLVVGENLVEFEFLAGDAALNRNEDYLYALFVPARASLTFPVFDQPDLKARWKLVLNLPPDWTAVSNGREVGRVGGTGQRGLVFAETEPIPTYLFSFAAGRFSIETAERDGRTLRMLHRESDAAKVARNRDAVFDLQFKALSWLEDYTALPYAFGKFDFVLIPSFQFGGMEHPGSVFYNADSLFLDEAATQTQMLGRASLIAHETAHMWFGDLVTMRWFNDVWMKEVFANVMAAKIVNPSFPEVNHDLRFLFSHYPAAYGVDRTEGANPIRQGLANLNEAGSLYGAIIYQKAPIVMRQLELLMGADAFRDGLREYLKAHRFGNATWSDLIAALDPRTDVDLVAWSRAWVEERGRPRITVKKLTGPDGPAVSIESDDPLNRGLTWPQEIEIAVGYAGKVDHKKVRLSGRDTVALDARLGTPQWILPTGGGLGYGEFVLETANLDAMASAMPYQADPLLRGSMLVTLWESMLDGRLAPAKLNAMLFIALPRENDELNTNRMLDYERTLFWRFTAADDRQNLAPKLETLLRTGLERATTTSRKAAWFGALRSVALTPSALQWLEGVWRRDVAIAKLPLAESDEADLALELAVRDVPDAEAMLQAQFDRFKNADRKARFAFVRQAVSSDPAVREQFFASLKDVKNRARESWVLVAAGYLHHPLRARRARSGARDPADGRHFFPEALGRCDALRLSVTADCCRSPPVHRRVAA